MQLSCAQGRFLLGCSKPAREAAEEQLPFTFVSNSLSSAHLLIEIGVAFKQRIPHGDLLSGACVAAALHIHLLLLNFGQL